MSRRRVSTWPSTACGATPSSTSRYRADMELNLIHIWSVTHTGESQPLYPSPKRRRLRDCYRRQFSADDLNFASAVSLHHGMTFRRVFPNVIPDDSPRRE